jgi:hypothetical protein
MADGRDKANPTLHLFDPLGSTLQATNQQAYAITFVGERIDCRAPAEVATASTQVLAPHPARCVVITNMRFTKMLQRASGTS